MQAMHGGQAKNDTIDAHQIAGLLRGGRLPQAYVYPAAMRATRELLRRRRHLTRKRAALLPHIQNTHSPYNLPQSGQQLAYQANRDGGATRVPEPAVPKSLEGELALIGHDDDRRTARELALVQTAQAHDAQPVSRLRSIPGGGQLLALGLLDDIHAIRRCPRVQACVSYGRLVQCAQESAGKRSGPSGQKIGNAYLPWAFSAAAVLCLRNHPAGPKYRARFEKQHRTGQALTGLAHQWARAVYDLLNRETAFDPDTFFTA
jgi:transposase